MRAIIPSFLLRGHKHYCKKNDDSDDDLSNGLGVKGSLNLYAWGGIEAGVKRDKQKEIYYDYKYYETQEELGKTIGKLYLRALRAKESLLINEQSLNRHNKLLNDLGVVVQYDSGRRSELIEARSRQLQVQTTIIQLRRTMELALSELSKYIPEPIKPEDLQDSGFAFEVQLSLTEKGQYAVAYGLSCKKDCHELHATDPRRTIPHPIPIPPLHPYRNRQTA